VPRKQREPHQQQEQIGQNHPFVREMLAQPSESCAKFEAGERQLVSNDNSKPRQCDRQRVAMEQRDPEESQREQNKLNRYSQQKWWFDHVVAST
jgi:hypothetical protein